MTEIKVGLVKEALKRGKAERPRSDLEYIRFKGDFKGVGRGTVIVQDRIIWGYPHIKRIFTLENGVRKNIGPGKTLFAEEKIDGFNVRIVSIKKEIYAFSRGGYLDLFVSEKARDDQGVARFLKDHPDHVLCGEMIGNTPYTKPEEGGDAQLFIFDICLGDGTYVQCEERYSMLEGYGIAGVPKLGRFASDDFNAMKRIILTLNKNRKEGMVLKSSDRSKAVKYVTPYSDIEDIAGNSYLFFDMPIGFFYQRALRSAFFIDDFALDKDEHAKRLGKAFYEGLGKAIKSVKDGREIDEEFEILIKDPRIWDDIHRHMSKEVRVEVLWRKEEGKAVRIRFRKIYKKTTKTLTAYAGGKGITD